MNKKCKWKIDDDCVYDTDCDNRFFFDTGTVKENKFKYCPLSFDYAIEKGINHAHKLAIEK